ncbi:hypothetical protein PBY51_019488 [Eleginops maclovinus]|uniref:Uncharacterized protein n=1 Tax=Eleginops maclovinus TaxID=56733 RepID=A0AAN7YBT6_ELEMC|nr:hypothetical protein PBY51_019488 [Eleginops maclovinus]
MESEVTPACTPRCGHPSDTTLLSQPAPLVRIPPLHLPLSLFPRSKQRLVDLINGRCQKRCQSILCLFGFIWTSGVLGWRDEGRRRKSGRKGYLWGEVVTDRGGKGGGRKKMMEVEEGEEEDYGCSSAQLSMPLQEDRRDPSAHHWRFIDFYPACSLSKIRYSASPLDLLTF